MPTTTTLFDETLLQSVEVANQSLNSLQLDCHFEDMNPASIQNIGETDVQKRGPFSVCETNRHEGHVPSAQLRVNVILLENDPGGAGALVSCKVSAELKLYGV